MRKAFRAAVLLLIAYLVQSTVLVYFRIGGIIPDILTVALYTCGYSFGLYGGICMGTAGALLMEIVGGELTGMTTVWCMGASCFGVYVAWRAGKPRPAGITWMKKLFWIFAPALGAGAIAAGKEALQLIYFYLTGVDVVFIHFFRVFFSALEVAVLTLVLLPLLRKFLLCPADQTFLARWKTRRKVRKAEKAEIEKVRKQKTSQDVQDLRRRLTYLVTLDDTAFDESEFPEEVRKEEKAQDERESVETQAPQDMNENGDEAETDEAENKEGVFESAEDEALNPVEEEE